MNRIIFLLILLSFTPLILAQTSDTVSKNKSERKKNYRLTELNSISAARDSGYSVYGSDYRRIPGELAFDSAYAPSRHFIVPALETVLLNVGVWSLSRYVNPMPWARISINSVKENFKNMWVWDADMFETNQFMHPYHGSTYFNFARSSGLNFWQSAPYSLGGSLMWELFMETNYPSRNDLISTTLGGIALGEMTYRLSSKLIDERKSGSERVFREIGAFLLAPTRGINRFFKGEMSRVKPKSSYEIENTRSSLSIGVGMNYRVSRIYNANGNVAIRYDLYYGNPYSTKDRKPFDFFKVKTIFNFGTQPLINQINIYGFILGKNFQYRDDQRMLLGLFQHFDYFNNTSYKIGAQSIGGGIIYKFPTLSDVDLESSIHFAGIILGGGSNIKEAFKYETDGTAFRDYNFGMGSTVKFESFVNIKNRGHLFVGVYLFNIFTVDGADGDDNLLIFNPRLSMAASPVSNIGLDFTIFNRTSNYVKYKTFKITVNEIKLFYSINL